MPTYKNTGNSAATIIVDGQKFPYDEEITVNRYVYDPNLTFISHSPDIKQKVVQLMDSSATSVLLSAIPKYDKLVIRNNTGGYVSVAFNQSATQTFRVYNNDIWTIHLDGKVKDVQFNWSATSGKLTVYGTPRI
jgi:hypothetical protein